MPEYIVQTYEGDMCIAADTCEILDDKLVFTIEGEVECVVLEWFLCARAVKERDLKVVK